MRRSILIPLVAAGFLVAPSFAPAMTGGSVQAEPVMVRGTKSNHDERSTVQGNKSNNLRTTTVKSSKSNTSDRTTVRGTKSNQDLKY
jgi:hypothetical protein